MRDRRGVLVFGVSFIAISALLGWVFWAATASIGSYRLATSMLAVPVISAMLASVGHDRRRKMVYAAVTLGVYVLSGLVAEFSGVHAVLSGRVPDPGPVLSLAVNVYIAWLPTFPLVMLLLFVGRRPELLWGGRRV